MLHYFIINDLRPTQMLHYVTLQSYPYIDTYTHSPTPYTTLRNRLTLYDTYVIL